MAKDRIYAEEMRTFDSSTLTGGYDLAMDPGFANPVVILRIINDSNKDVYISYDGATNHDYIIYGKALQLQFQANSGPNNREAKLAKGTKIYLKGVAGTGNIYIGGYYLE